MKLYALAVALLLCTASFSHATTLGIEDKDFTIDGQRAFLIGISYYGALGGAPEQVRSDLDDIQRHGFNWLRVWVNWRHVAALGSQGEPVEPFFSRLRDLVKECDQ